MKNENEADKLALSGLDETALYSVGEIAPLILVSERTVRKYCEDKVFENAVKIGGRYWLIPGCDVIANYPFLKKTVDKSLEISDLINLQKIIDKKTDRNFTFVLKDNRLDILCHGKKLRTYVFYDDVNKILKYIQFVKSTYYQRKAKQIKEIEKLKKNLEELEKELESLKK